jgi:hypothetical protein
MSSDLDGARSTTLMPECVSGRRRFVAVMSYTALAVFVLGLWWHQASLIDLAYAWKGQSPIQFANRALRPQDYESDFSQGSENMSASLPMMVYPWLAAYCQIPPEITLKGYILVDYAWISLALVLLTRVLRPQAPPIVAVLVTIIVLASDFSKMELARFGTSSGLGLYYCAADGFRLLAVASLVRGRFLAAWILLAAAYTCHPIMGGVGIAFLLGYLAVTPGKFRTRSFILGAVVASLVIGLWTIRVRSLLSPSETTGSVEMWFKTAQMTNFHWFPFLIGVFTTYHDRHFLPLLAFLMLMVHYGFRDQDSKAPPLRSMASGMAALVLLIVLGLLFSMQEISPTLVKMCLHRACLLLITLGLVYVVAGLWKDIVSGAWWQRVGAAVVLMSPFLQRAGFPVAFCFVLAAPGLWRACRLRTGRAEIVTYLAVSGGTVAAVVAYVLAGYVNGTTRAAYVGSRMTIECGLGLGLLLVVLWILSRRFPQAARVFPVAFLVLFACGAMRSARDHPISRGEVPRCRDYLDAQLWARRSTPPNTLFLVDPTIYYGWRDYSQRCSFGNLREWIYSWHYAMDYRNFQQGVERLAAFGIRLDDYLPEHPCLDDSIRCGTALRKAYYEADSAWFSAMVRDYGADYFVMQKQHLDVTRRLDLEKHLHVAYENDHFLIFAGRGPGQRDSPCGGQRLPDR